MRTFGRILLWMLLAILLVSAGTVAWHWDFVQRVFLGGVKIYETEPPKLPTAIKRPAILVFSKTNGFRHEEAIPAANRALASMAHEQGWGFYQTENGAAFDPSILARFDAVIFNNVSGDVLTPAQKTAFRAFVERGGGYVGIHAAGDDSHSWPWFVNNLIGAKFIGHPMDPQFQRASVRTEGDHPAIAGLPRRWGRADEWYSFDASPRSKSFNVALTIDETSYSPVGMFGKDLAMGADHPVAWWRCTGRGRTFYSALGHTAASYSEAENIGLLKGAIKWALGGIGPGCDEALAAEDKR
jgi:type 1 glutamine amidotransferase